VPAAATPRHLFLENIEYFKDVFSIDNNNKKSVQSNNTSTNNDADDIVLATVGETNITLQDVFPLPVSKKQKLVDDLNVSDVDNRFVVCGVVLILFVLFCHFLNSLCLWKKRSPIPVIAWSENNLLAYTVASQVELKPESQKVN
jgi:hypothetical protein